MSMNTLLRISLALVASAAAVLTVQAGDPPRFTLGPAVIGGAGGMAQGGRFQLEGSVLPLPAGSLDSPRFQLVAGLVAPITVLQVEKAPRLSIALLPGGQVQLDWAATAGEFTLHGTLDPVAGPWMPVGQPVLNTQAGRRVVLPADALLRCYRLQPAAGSAP